jgi:hypothetical protein
MQTLHPKVKLPAIVGTVATLALAVLAGLGTVPELAPICTAATTAINTTVGYFTYAG